jgi:hypothetical protein
MQVQNENVRAIQTSYHTLVQQVLSTGQQDLLSLAYLLDLECEPRFAGFAPNPLRRIAEKEIKFWCIEHGVWHPRSGDIYNTMTGYLHPVTVETKHLVIIGKVYALLYFMDDYIGNEKQKHLTPQEQQNSALLLTRLSHYLIMVYKTNKLDGKILSDSGIERAVHSVLHEIWQVVDQVATAAAYEWFTHFVSHLLHHLQNAIVEQDSDKVYTVDEYIQIRDQVSGMKPAVLLMELANENFLPRSTLENYGLAKAIEELELYCIRYGGLVNDLFSFYKEVMEDHTVFNLVSIIYLNQIREDPKFSLLDSIFAASEYLVRIKDEFFILAGQIQNQLGQMNISDTLRNQLVRYIDDLKYGIVATWRWQIEDGNPRYARPRQYVLFEEIALRHTQTITQ